MGCETRIERTWNAAWQIPRTHVNGMDMSNAKKIMTGLLSRTGPITLADLVDRYFEFQASSKWETAPWFFQGPNRDIRAETLEGIVSVLTIIKRRRDPEPMEMEIAACDALLRISENTSKDAGKDMSKDQDGGEFDAFIERDQLRPFLDALDTEIALCANGVKPVPDAGCAQMIGRALDRLRNIEHARKMGFDLEFMEPRPGARFH